MAACASHHSERNDSSGCSNICLTFHRDISGDEDVMLEDGLLLILAGSEEHVTPTDSFKKELDLVEEMKVQLQEITPAAVELLVLVPVQVPVPVPTPSESEASRSKRKFARRAIAKKDKEVKKAAKAEKTSKKVAAKKLKAG